MLGAGGDISEAQAHGGLHLPPSPLQGSKRTLLALLLAPGAAPRGL